MSENSSAANPRICLASASPRRQALLAQVGLPFMLLPQHIDETLLPGEGPEAYVNRLAREKAAAAFRDPARPADLPVLAADTTVVCDDEVLGKPQSMEEAALMLGRLSGRGHQVLTAVALHKPAPGDIQVITVSTQVEFRELSRQEIVAYWNTGEPQDKAGAYAIQGLGAMFVSRVEGSYTNVVGLPLFETLQLLASVSIPGLSLLEGAAR
jgi:septum formation protein